MADRAHIPSSPACGQWETLLTDALDGLLKPEDEATFAGHMAGCQNCTALFDEARRGREWLEYLSPEPEVPSGLLDKILAQTGPGQGSGYGLISGGAKALPVTPAWQRPGYMGQIRRFAEPRLLMTAAMAFFSIALTLNLTGVRLSSLRLADLRPAAVRSFMERRLTTASVPIVRYYDHLRFVYEVESRMRELRRGGEGEGQAPDNSQPKPNDAAPGESRQTPGQNPGHKDGGSRMDPPPQQSGKPATGPVQDDSGVYLETSFTFHGTPRAFRRLQNGTTGTIAGERSAVWTA
jgi:hypothetical protein